jgi:ATP/maltotriose-dependent transcriptional regulator MalT
MGQDVRAQARDAFARRAWREATTAFAAIDSPTIDDLESLAAAAYLVGDGSTAIDAWTRAYQAATDTDDPHRAARNAFWIGFTLLNRGDMAPAVAWFGRAAAAIGDEECAEAGYVLIPAAVQAMFGGDPDTALGIFRRAADIAVRYKEPDLLALARMGIGQSLRHKGDIAAGMALLDEAMVSITANEVSPVVAGFIYCGVIVACREAFDLRRAHQWTTALVDWCASQPDLVPYRGQCLVHRSELLTARGNWRGALDEAERAREDLSTIGSPAIGDAFYQLGELRRMRGEHALAEAEYRRANEAGRVPQPGLALLRLATGQAEAANATMKRLLDEPGERIRLLPAAVEIRLAVGDIAGARTACDELRELVTHGGSDYLRGVGARAHGATLLAEGDARAASAALREAFDIFRDLGAVYESARTRVLIAKACHELGDADGAALEADAARATFGELGAADDLAMLDERQRTPGGLTQREVEVLRLVAAGKTNRAIATELVLSEKTVARHVSNIFTKLGVASRAAATAYAYENDLV